jgi:hypothetical protein
LLYYTAAASDIWDFPDQNELYSIEFPMSLPCFDMDILICIV